MGNGLWPHVARLNEQNKQNKYKLHLSLLHTHTHACTRTHTHTHTHPYTLSPPLLSLSPPSLSLSQPLQHGAAAMFIHNWDASQEGLKKVSQDNQPYSSGLKLLAPEHILVAAGVPTADL